MSASQVAGTVEAVVPREGAADAKSAGARRDRLAQLSVAAAALVAETLLMAAGASGSIGVALALALHVAVLVALGLHLATLSAASADTSPAQLTLAATAAAGPFGALGALVHLVFDRKRPEASALLDAWYQRIALSSDADPVTQVCEEVAVGRTIDLSAPAPRSFDGVIANGTLVERQTALGLIARQFHPEYVPALVAALKSPEPVVRVQAAAVAARVRGDLKRKVREALTRLDEIGTREEALNLAVELEAATRSGLLDESERLRAEAAVERLKSAAASLPAASAPVPRRLSARASGVYEAGLFNEGRFREWRIARRRSTIAARGRYRIRRFRTRASDGSVSA